MPAKKRPHRPTRRDTPGRDVTALVRRGWSRRDADSLVAVTAALRRAGTAPPDEQRLLARRVAEALRREPVAHAAAAYLTDPRAELGWRMLAEWLDGDERVALLDLAARCAGLERVSVPPDEAESLLDAGDLDVLTAARAAEARGEFARALQLLESVTRPLDDGWRKDLLTLSENGEALPPAVWGRWICSAALRYSLDMPAGLQVAQHYAAVVLEACGATPDQIRDLTLTRAMQDQIVHDVVLFDCGSLEGYLAGPLSPQVKARVPGIDSWPAARLAVLRLTGPSPDGGSSLCRDVRTGTDVVIGDPALATEHPAGRCFIGRLVRVDGDDRDWFATRPTIIDDLTASRLATLSEGDTSIDRRLVELHRGMAGPQRHAC